MRERTGVFLALAALLITAAFFVVREETPRAYLEHVPDGGRLSADLMRDIPALAESRGVPFAVAVVAEAIGANRIGNGECHTLLHLIGHEAYARYGDDLDALLGVDRERLCIGSYLHGIEAQMAQASADPKRSLFALCARIKALRIANGPCFHGVGHGAFELERDVGRSLAYCDALRGGPEPELWNCYRGVFSELGNALLGLDTNTGLPVPPLRLSGVGRGRPFLPCEALAERYLESCYTQLSKLVYEDRDLPASFARCRDATAEKRWRRACVSIVAGIAGRERFLSGELEELAQASQSLPPESLDAFIAGVVEGWRGYATTREEGRRSFDDFCAFLDGAAREHCERAARALEG